MKAIILLMALNLAAVMAQETFGSQLIKDELNKENNKCLGGNSHTLKIFEIESELRRDSFTLTQAHYADYTKDAAISVYNLLNNGTDISDVAVLVERPDERKFLLIYECKSTHSGLATFVDISKEKIDNYLLNPYSNGVNDFITLYYQMKTNFDTTQPNALNGEFVGTAGEIVDSSIVREVMLDKLDTQGNSDAR